jgi:hypothetical protein
LRAKPGRTLTICPIWPSFSMRSRRINSIIAAPPYWTM